MGQRQDKLMSMLSPPDRERILKECLSYELDPDDPAFIPFALTEKSLIRIEAMRDSIESLILTIPQQHQQSIGMLNKTLIEHTNYIVKALSAHSTAIENTFAAETQKRSEQIAAAVGVKLEAVLAKSRAPMIANLWLSVAVGFAVAAGIMGIMWIIYNIPTHGRLAVAAACCAVLAQWGKEACVWFIQIFSKDGEPVGR